jgi:threonine/homoserine/homoserine lactone efflux protein
MRSNCTVSKSRLLYLSSAAADRYRERESTSGTPAMSSLAASVFPLIVMIFVTSITPGPNNLMLMLAGTRFGFVRTLPHLAGVSVGGALVICLTYAGLGALMLRYPRFVDALSVACAVYLMWLAGRLWMPSTAAGGKGPGRRGPVVEPRPMRFTEALLFQFVNPKVWTMGIAAASIAGRFPLPPAVTLGVVALVVVCVNSPCVALWAAFGRAMRRHLEHAGTRRWFDGAMALLIVATAAWILRPVLGG